MATRKPDWADRMVEKLLEDCTAIPEADGWIAIKRHDFASLLRAHHRKVKRMVFNKRKSMQVESSWGQGYIDACEDILDKLKELEQ